MTHETSGDWYPIWEIKQDLNKEKSQAIDDIYSHSTSMWGSQSEEHSEFTAKKMERVEEINRILYMIRFGV